MNWKIDDLFLHLKYTWSIARGASKCKNNLIVTISNSNGIGIGEVAPNVRYNESPEDLKVQFQQFAFLVKETQIDTIEELHFFMSQIKLAQSLKFGIESAWVHLNYPSFSNFAHIDLPQSIATSFSIPILPSNELNIFFDDHNLQRFSYLKLKINSDNGLDALTNLAQITNQPLIIDANEAFDKLDDFLNFQDKIAYPNVIIIEQPLPADHVTDYQLLKPKARFPIYGDESVISKPNFDLLCSQFHGINMKLMKAGGYLEGINILQNAKHFGLKTMIGCMIESTLGIKSAFYLGSLAEIHDLDGFLVVKDEPFSLLSEINGQLYDPNT